jgi:integrase/recombinase XerC
MTIHPSVPRLVQEFFRVHMTVRRNLSVRTIRTYRDAMRLFLGFAARAALCEVSRLEIDHLGREVVLAFLDDLEATRRNCPRTRNARLAAIHSFFRFVAAEEPSCAELCQRVLGVPSKRRDRAAVTCLRREEVEHILHSVDRSRPAGRRDFALLMFLYNTGARAQEVVDLCLSAVRMEPPLQVRVLGKGRKERLCPLWPETTEAINQMLRDRPTAVGPSDRLFVNCRAAPLTRFGLRYIVQSRLAVARATRPSLGEKRVSPHTFRHTTALHLIQSGVDLNVVRSWLGHSSVATTNEYIEIDMNMKRQALDACGPPERPAAPPAWREPDILTWLKAL